MRSDGTSLPLTPELDRYFGVVVADGYGMKIHVRNRRLVVEDGFGDQRRQREFHRATASFDRLVVLGHTGYISLEAIRWLDGIGAALVHLDKDGRLLLTSTALGRDHAGLRRAQARVADSDIGAVLARGLLVRKLTDQTSVLRDLGMVTAAVSELDRRAEDAGSAAGLDSILAAEAAGAKAYWEALAGVEVRFPKAELAKVPEHWRTFGGRRSPVGGKNRNAANPANAMLNYLYRLAEAESVLALATLGLDPGIGIWHVDTANRDSLALDILEAIRPQIDRYLFEMLDKRTFSWGDFHETAQGVCRILPPLTHVLAEAMPMLGSWVAPVTEEVARMVGEGADPPVLVGTPLTKDGLSRSKNAIRKSGRAETLVRPRRRPSVCRLCGITLANAERVVCDTCLPTYDADRTAKLSRAGKATLASMRASADDPAKTEEARAKQATRSREVMLANRAWEREHGRSFDVERYEAEVLPRLREMTIPALMHTTGLSQYYLWRVRKGERRLHPRHWDAILPAPVAGPGSPKGGAAAIASGEPVAEAFEAAAFPAEARWDQPEQETPG